MANRENKGQSRAGNPPGWEWVEDITDREPAVPPLLSNVALLGWEGVEDITDREPTVLPLLSNVELLWTGNGLRTARGEIQGSRYNL